MLLLALSSYSFSLVVVPARLIGPSTCRVIVFRVAFAVFYGDGFGDLFFCSLVLVGHIIFFHLGLHLGLLLILTCFLILFDRSSIGHFHCLKLGRSLHLSDGK